MAVALVHFWYILRCNVTSIDGEEEPSQVSSPTLQATTSSLLNDPKLDPAAEIKNLSLSVFALILPLLPQTNPLSNKMPPHLFNSSSDSTFQILRLEVNAWVLSARLDNYLN